MHTCGTQRHKSLSVLPEYGPVLSPDRQLRQEVVNEVERGYRSQVPLQLVQNQQLHLLRVDEDREEQKDRFKCDPNRQMQGLTKMVMGVFLSTCGDFWLYGGTGG